MLQPGPYFPDRNQPVLSDADKETVRLFHELYYRRWDGGGDTINSSWFGHHLLKCPLDLWMYQELIVRARPEVIVETGTYFGGSALFFAMIFDLLGDGEVITIDVDARKPCPEHPRIKYISGSSIDPLIVSDVGRLVGKRRAFVILDSNHSAGHVYDEIVAYKSLVRLGDFLIVEDTNVNGHPVLATFGPGPAEAVQRFLAESDEFEVDRRCERFLMTLNPGGYLRRVRETL